MDSTTTDATAAPATVRSWRFADARESEAFRDAWQEPLVRFLHRHLDRFGDPAEQIRRCLEQASSQEPQYGGTVTVALEGDDIVAAAVTRDTHMGGYAPENLLVYVAAHGERRGRGLGRQVLEGMLGVVDGDVALHVEPDNPAQALYEKLGFTHAYREMRLRR